MVITDVGDTWDFLLAIYIQLLCPGCHGIHGDPHLLTKSFVCGLNSSRELSQMNMGLGRTKRRKIYCIACVTTTRLCKSTIQRQWNSSSHGRHNFLAIFIAAVDSVINHYRKFARGRGGGGGWRYKVIGAYTDLCTSLQRQLGKQDFYSISSLDKGVFGCMYGGENVAKFLRITC